MRRFAIALLVTSVAVVTDTTVAPIVSAQPSPSDETRPESARLEIRCATALQLFSAVEDAWFRSDTDRLAALVDTASVHIAVKPGAMPTNALTRSAAAFLFQDQLRLVQTQAFQVTRVNVGKTTATAVARWIADWGGRQGVRTVEVSFLATPSGGRWLLTEVRAKD